MASFQDNMNEYQKQLTEGSIQVAYRGLMQYMLGLITNFKKKFTTFSVPGNIYYGYMDMTYFSIIPKPLKNRKLKVAVAFFHESFRFEAWLAGVNKQVQAEYWHLFKENGWSKYPLVPNLVGSDSIIEHILVDKPDFNNLDTLTNQIEKETINFILSIQDILATL
ncbi:MAG: hypothetical protein MUO40_04635 [Anaerolineaceae bacterium]|nr:hypothetical protein [Anaerolineaceae bacterium]